MIYFKCEQLKVFLRALFFTQPLKLYLERNQEFVELFGKKPGLFSSYVEK